MDRTAHIGGVDIVRFITAVMVMNFHICFWSWGARKTSFAASGGAAQYPELMHFTWFGGVGVQVFFVVSGFVIAYSAGGKTPFQFLRSRFWRLYPAVWLAAPLTAATIIYVGIQTALPVGELLLRSLVLYPIGPWVDAVYWSLAVEIAFYSLVLLMLALRVPRLFEILAIGLALASLCYFVGITWFGFSRVNAVWLLQDGQYFALGIVIGLVRENGLKARYIAAAIVAIFTAYLELQSIRGGRSLILFYSWLIAWSVCVVGLCFAVFVPFRGTAFTRRIGLMTYPLYLLHDVIGCSILRLTPEIGRWPALFLALATVLTLALIVTSLEPVLRNLLSSGFRRLTPTLKADAL